MNQTMLILLGGVAVLLAIASVIGFVLSRRTTSDGAGATIDNLNARIRAWWLMVAMFAIAFVTGKLVTIALFALTSFYCLREFISITPTRAEDHRSLAAAFYLFIPLQYWLVATGWTTLFTILIPVWAFLLLPVLAVVRGETEDFLPRTARIQWALMLTVFCVSHAPALLNLKIPGFERQGFLLLFFLIAVVQLSDVLQYVFGKLLGQRKIAPRVSPSKTWEGLIGGALTSTLIGSALWWITPFSPLQAAAMAFAICWPVSSAAWYSPPSSVRWAPRTGAR
ncbi:MAG: phosphatidate cytidylyltransferase [Novosphingobium sp.]|nr:phosphatidate cytidylyltransferase [Novosphingobium sp.]